MEHTGTSSPRVVHGGPAEIESKEEEVDLLDLFVQQVGDGTTTVIRSQDVIRTASSHYDYKKDEDDDDEEEDQEAKAQQRKNHKERFFREIIKLVLVDPPSTTWNVERFRLSPEFLQKLIDRALTQQQQQQQKEEQGEDHQDAPVAGAGAAGGGVSIAYLKTRNSVKQQEEYGRGSIIILPADVQRLCNKDDTYEIVLSYPNKTVDSINDDSYVGQMHFVFRNVPSLSQNQLYPVEAKHIQRWIRQSLLREDRDLIQLENQISKLRSELKIAMRRMQNISQEVFFDKKGVLMKGASADEKRQALHDMLEEKTRTLQKDIENKEEEKLKTYLQKCDEIDLSLSQSDVDNHTWTVELKGCHKEYYEKLLLKNSNWKTTIMYASPTSDDEDDDDDKKRQHKDRQPDSEYLVDVTNISVARVEHGFGCYHYHHNDTVVESLNDDDPGRCTAYHGTYHNGFRHGSGIMYTSNYMYCGSFQQGIQHGIGTMVQKDGDVIRSTFGLSSKASSKRKNRYARGLPNGKSTITFSDGAYYEGDMQNGMITGQGVYISAKGDKLKGQFVNGALVRGTMQTSNGEIYHGQYRDGRLHGKGTYESKSKRYTYEGTFLDGEKHGRGIETFYRKRAKEPLAVYKGSFVNNCRSGIGCMELTDSGFDYGNQEKESLRIDGPFIAGEPTRGGMITNVDLHCSIPTTTRPSSSYRLLNRFRRVEEHKDVNLLRKIQENQVQEYRFRAILESKKKDIYDTHHQNLLNMSLNGKVDLKEQETRSLSPFARHDINCFRVYAPRSVHEAEVCPGVKVQNVPTDNCNESVLQGLFRSIKESWTAMGIDLEKWKPFMQPVSLEFDLIQEKWDNINVDHIWGEVVSSSKFE